MNELGQRIAAEIRDKGAITFVRWMELALYCPNFGYFEKEEDNIGRRGDYYTSVSVGSLFGELLAFQFAQWLQECSRPTFTPPAPDVTGKESVASQAIQIVEAGAHNGDLASDILGWLRRHRPLLYQPLEYWIVEPSETRRARQQRRLCEYGQKVRWLNAWAELTNTSKQHHNPRHSSVICGIIFSNELLDAMPVHRMGWDSKERTWFEWGVTLQAGQFVWTRISPTGPRRSEPRPLEPSLFSHLQLSLDKGLLDLLPDGFTTEVCPAAEEWWKGAAAALRHGKLVTVDYGLSADEFFLPERKDGTLRGYYRHQLTSNVLANPGDQDITASVNFTAIQAAGEAVGLRTDALLTQAEFLTRVAERTWTDQGLFTEWTAARTRQFQTLTHPDHLGRSFRVLVQSRRE